MTKPIPPPTVLRIIELIRERIAWSSACLALATVGWLHRGRGSSLGISIDPGGELRAHWCSCVGSANSPLHTRRRLKEYPTDRGSQEYAQCQLLRGSAPLNGNCSTRRP